jgi:hypothetical protein
MSKAAARKVLVQRFDARHVDAALKHYEDATQKYIEEDWDGVALKAGKFVEAVTKALVLYCGKTLPQNSRNFKAGVELRQLEQTNGSYGDIVRIVIPKACIYIYEIVNNRGGRHDAGEIDANEFDAKAVIPMLQWILAELVRFSTVGGDIGEAAKLIDGVVNKIIPAFENVDGRTYVNFIGVSAPDVALLLLYKAYPKRLGKGDLITAVMRHKHSKPAATMAVSRLGKVVDETDSGLKLRLPGRKRAEDRLKKLKEAV